MPARASIFIFSTRDFSDTDIRERLFRALSSAQDITEPKSISSLDTQKRFFCFDSWVEIFSANNVSSSAVVDLKDGQSLQFHWRTPTKFSVISATLKLDDSKLSDSGGVLALFKDLARASKACYGEIRCSQDSGLKPFDLVRRLPDIPNVLMLGPDYFQIFAEEKIRTAPVESVLDLGSAGYCLVVADSLDVPVLEEQKALLRQYLGEDAFMSGGRFRYKSGRAPVFRFV